MNFEPVEKIANAVLYEGFLLYPYRPSAIKNQQRWHFGTLGPIGGSDPSEMQTECLIETFGDTEVDCKDSLSAGRCRAGINLSAHRRWNPGLVDAIFLPAYRRKHRN